MSEKPKINWDAGDAGFDETDEGPEGIAEAGTYAENYDHTERPRRVQTNVKIADEVKQAFKEQVKADNREMQFVVEDLLRLYIRSRR